MANRVPGIGQSTPANDEGLSEFSLLHFTNGDAAAHTIAAAGVAGTIIPWRDTLHDGPVPAGLTLNQLRDARARFIAGCGWATYAGVMADFSRRDEALSAFRSHDEAVLWFEHDLYDQLQLLQILAWFAEQDPSGEKLTLVSSEEYLGPARPERLRELFQARQPVTQEQLRLARVAWLAFCSPDPTSMVELLRGDTAALPYLAGAFRRHLQQFPSTRNGLSRSEEQALSALASGSRTLRDAFFAAQANEAQIFLGDTTFAWYLQRLSGNDQPLVTWADGERLGPPDRLMVRDEWQERPLVITVLGRAVLGGQADCIAMAGIDRWLGGTHLTTADHWRWNWQTHEVEHWAGSHAQAKMAGPD